MVEHGAYRCTEIDMTSLPQASSIRELTLVGNLIHDQWFDVDGIEFEPGTGLLAIPFRGGIRLEIRGVDTLKLEDSEKVQWYDFTRFRYDRDESLLTIETGIPLLFQVRIRELDVRLMKTA